MGTTDSIFRTSILSGEPSLAKRMKEVFGDPGDPIEFIQARAEELFSGRQVIVWEGDPQTFQFSYVSPAAESILGYPCDRWVSDPNFWTGTVVHPEDRSDAVAFCALATGRGENHDFCYRARAADGRTVVLHDVVHVLVSPRKIPVRLRGVMAVIDPSHDERGSPTGANA